jgi:GNAT superfamily N-acetyltransferase
VVLTLRPAEPADAAAVAGVHVRAWQEGYHGLLPAEYLDTLRLEDRMHRYTFGRTDPGAPMTLVALRHGVVCGFVTTGPSPDEDLAGAAEVHALYVDPAAWGTGVGRRLMAGARRDLRRQGYAEAALWVLAGNARAERFYGADGWRPDGGRRNHEVWGVLVDERRFRRALD